MESWQLNLHEKDRQLLYQQVHNVDCSPAVTISQSSQTPHLIHEAQSESHINIYRHVLKQVD